MSNPRDKILNDFNKNLFRDNVVEERTPQRPINQPNSARQVEQRGRPAPQAVQPETDPDIIDEIYSSQAPSGADAADQMAATADKLEAYERRRKDLLKNGRGFSDK